MKIGLYLQNSTDSADYCAAAKREFNYVLAQCKELKLDLLVTPEDTVSDYIDDLYEISPWDEFSDGNEQDKYYDIAARIAEEAGCPVIYGHVHEYEDPIENAIFAMYCNPWADDSETKFYMYMKNTATDLSPLAFDNYKDIIHTFFKPIIYKGARLGLTICYDNYHPLFSRAYGVQGIDVLVNCTGGHVDYNKWGNLQKVRALENQCHSFCTMSYDVEDHSNSSYTYGYTPTGNKLQPSLANGQICRDEIEQSVPGKLYIYEIEPSQKLFSLQPDERIDQPASRNKYEEFFLPTDFLQKNSTQLKRIEESLYVLHQDTCAVIIGVIPSTDILKPEVAAKLLYSPKLHEYQNPRFILINQWENLSQSAYESIYFPIIKGRATENYCAVMLTSNQINECIQSTDTKKAQRLQQVDHGYWLDLSRCSGPNAIWKNKKKTMMRKEWRAGYEALLNWILTQPPAK